MQRPCFLVLDREFPGNISTRKLVIETAKLNVITAYDPDEAIQTLKRFPNVDGVVFDAELEGVASCSKLAERLLQVRRDLPIIITSPGAMAVCGNTAHYVESHNPERLLNFLRSLYEGATKEFDQKEEQLYDTHPQNRSKAS